MNEMVLVRFAPTRIGSGALAPVTDRSAGAVTMSEVLIARLHPPAIFPASPAVSSTTYKDQVPLGSIPLNTDRSVFVKGGGGAGGRNVPTLPLILSMVGL